MLLHTIFRTIYGFLNSQIQTIYGPGLGLEVGNSFWFFNGSKSPQLSYFNGLTDKETDFAQ